MRGPACRRCGSGMVLKVMEVVHAHGVQPMSLKTFTCERCTNERSAARAKSAEEALTREGK